MSDDDGEPQDGEEAADDAAPPSAVDPKRLRKLKVDAKLQARESAQFWRGVFADPVGRREMWGLLQVCRTFESVFGTGPNGFPQPELSEWNRGRKDLGSQLFRTWLARDPLAVAEMLAEHDDDFKRFHAPEGTLK
jgi:hypothetical protein